MKNRLIRASLFAFFVIVSTSQTLNAQAIAPAPSPLWEAKPSLTGLEVSDYKQVEIIIDKPDEGMKAFGWTEDFMRKTIEQRLRDAGLEPAPMGTRPEKLVVSVKAIMQVSPPTYSLLLWFKRPILFQAGNEVYRHTWSTTWDIGGFGMLTGNPGQLLLFRLEECLNKFLSAYLKANRK